MPVNVERVARGPGQADFRREVRPALGVGEIDGAGAVDDAATGHAKEGGGDVAVGADVGNLRVLVFLRPASAGGEDQGVGQVVVDLPENPQNIMIHAPAAGEVLESAEDEAAFRVSEVLREIVEPGRYIDGAEGSIITDFIRPLVLLGFRVGVEQEQRRRVDIGAGRARRIPIAENIGDGAVAEAWVRRASAQWRDVVQATGMRIE